MTGAFLDIDNLSIPICQVWDQSNKQMFIDKSFRTCPLSSIIIIRFLVWLIKISVIIFRHIFPGKSFPGHNWTKI